MSSFEMPMPATLRHPWRNASRAWPARSPVGQPHRAAAVRTYAGTSKGVAATSSHENLEHVIAPNRTPNPTAAATADPGDSAFGIEDRTDPRAWDEWVAALPDAELNPGRVVVLAPHPDDETFGCGGLIAQFCARSISVTVITVTDGAASHRHHLGLAGRRQAEQRQAIRALGCTEPPVWLGLPDGGVLPLEARLAGELDGAVAGSDLLVAPWSGDGHVDHEVVGRVGLEVGRRHGIRVVSYPVWAWRWAVPSDLAGLSWTQLSLSDDAVRAKRAAIGCYPSQTTALLGDVIVDEAMVDRFSRPFEVYVDA